MSSATRHLDIRHVLKKQKHFDLLLRLILTPSQLEIFKLQRATLQSGRGEASGSSEYYESSFKGDSLGQRRAQVNDFISDLGEVKFCTGIDKKLLLGLMIRSDEDSDPTGEKYDHQVT